MHLFIITLDDIFTQLRCEVCLEENNVRSDAELAFSFIPRQWLYSNILHHLFYVRMLLQRNKKEMEDYTVFPCICHRVIHSDHRHYSFGTHYNYECHIPETLYDTINFEECRLVVLFGGCQLHCKTVLYCQLLFNWFKEFTRNNWDFNTYYTLDGTQITARQAYEMFFQNETNLLFEMDLSTTYSIFLWFTQKQHHIIRNKVLLS